MPVMAQIASVTWYTVLHFHVYGFQFADTILIFLIIIIEILTNLSKIKAIILTIFNDKTKSKVIFDIKKT